MKFYCGIDLSARDCHACVINEQLQLMVQQKLRNELPKIVKLLKPYKADPKIVVKSIFNWYWLIDGLQAQNNVKRDAAWPARLAVWCSSLPSGNSAGNDLVPSTRLLTQVTKSCVR